MKKIILLFITVFALCVSAGFSQTTASPTVSPAASDADREAIKQTALDYVEGWYEGNVERMERALHPELAKRIVRTNEKGQSSLGQMSAMTLVQNVKRGGGKQTPKERQQKDITILDVFA